MILLYFWLGYFLWQESEALSHQSNIPLSSKFKDAVKDYIKLIRKTQFIAKKVIGQLQQIFKEYQIPIYFYSSMLDM